MTRARRELHVDREYGTMWRTPADRRSVGAYQVSPGITVLAARIVENLGALQVSAMPLQQVLDAVRRMESDGLVERYAIGGAVGATIYLEPAATFDEKWALFTQQFLDRR